MPAELDPENQEGLGDPAHQGNPESLVLPLDQEGQGFLECQESQGGQEDRITINLLLQLSKLASNANEENWPFHYQFTSPPITDVMVAKKDVHMPKHPELADKNVPNLHVMKAMQSLKSRGYLKEQFAWRHCYWYLTNEGFQYLHDYLHLPPEIVPATLRCSRPETGRPQPKGLEGEQSARLTRGEADTDTYRRSAVPPGADKKAEAGAGKQQTKTQELNNNNNNNNNPRRRRPGA
ncbi:hypothetical protein GH733_019333 [Mirounga leonina]|nr:hypothetical protein GH733_019333 [Mirounga leonina]